MARSRSRSCKSPTARSRSAQRRTDRVSRKERAMALAKARVVEITSYIPQRQEGSEVPASADGAGIEAHFNPQTLKVSINSNNQGGNQPGGGSGKQFVGSGTSSLQVELLFDTTVERKGAARNSDVR